MECLVEFEDTDTGLKLSYKEILSEAHIMLIAGTETASNGMTFLIHAVLKSPEVIKKLLTEIDNAPVNGEFISYATCKEMKYLNAVVKEILRMFPLGAAGFPRLVPQGGRTVMGHNLPEGVECAVPIYALHNSTKLWKKPNEFNPERWINPSEDLQHYMPFLLGPRRCIGKE